MQRTPPPTAVGMLFSIAPARRDPRTEQLRNLASPDWLRRRTAQSFLRPEFARSRLECRSFQRLHPSEQRCVLRSLRLQSPMFGLDPTERHNRTVLTARCRGRFGTRTRQQPRHHPLAHLTISMRSPKHVNSPRGPILHVKETITED